MVNNPFQTPPEWDHRTGWQRLRDGLRRGWRAYDEGLQRLQVSHLRSCLLLGCGSMILALLLVMAGVLCYYLFSTAASAT